MGSVLCQIRRHSDLKDVTKQRSATIGKLSKPQLMNLDKDWIDALHPKNVADLSVRASKLKINTDSPKGRAFCVDIITAAANLSKSNCKYMSIILNFMGKCCFKLKMVDEEIYSSLEKAILLSVVAELTQGKHYSNIMHSLGKMGAEWPGLNNELRSVLLDRMKVLCPNLDTHSISNLIYSLGEMQMVLRECDTDVHESVYAMATQLFRTADTDQRPGQAISNTVLGLANMDVKYDDMPQELQNAIWVCLESHWEKFDPQGISNIVYS